MRIHIKNRAGTWDRVIVFERNPAEPSTWIVFFAPWRFLRLFLGRKMSRRSWKFPYSYTLKFCEYCDTQDECGPAKRCLKNIGMPYK